MKGYIKRISFRREPPGRWIDVDFGSTKEGAGFWPSLKEAQMDAEMLEHHDIAITTAEGQRHICKGYQIEERIPGQFVIWVDAPFVASAGTDQPVT